MRISKKKLYCFCMIFLMFNAVFMRFQYIGKASMIRYTIVFLLGIMVFPASVNMIKKLNHKLITVGGLYFALVLISAFINRNSHVITHTVVSALVYICILIESVIVIKYVQLKYGGDYLFRTISSLFLFYILVNDMLLLLYPKMFFTSNATYYLFGNKFAVAYRHLEYLAILIIKHNMGNKKKQRRYKFSIAVFILLCFIIFNNLQGGSGGSATGIVAIIIMLLLYFIPKQILENQYIYISSAIGATVFVVVFDTVLSVQLIQNFIVNFLHKDMTLTGRAIIYKFIPEVLSNHLLFGYGHGSSYETWMKFTHIYPNSQNGYIDCIVEQGLLATIVLFMLVMLTISIFKKNSMGEKKFYPMLTLIYTYSIISCVEVTISIVFVWWVVFLFLLSIENEDGLVERQSFY